MNVPILQKFITVRMSIGRATVLTAIICIIAATATIVLAVWG